MTTRYTFPKSSRLGGRGTFNAIRDSGLRESRGPITIWLVPIDSPKSRLGISIGRHVGTAPRRNRIKRLLRETFRLMQHDLPRSYDILISVKPHVPLILAEYQKLLSSSIIRLHGKWEQKQPTKEPPCAG